MTDPAETAIEDLVAANRILAAKGILDEYGHLSAREAAGAPTFLMSRVSAPAMVSAESIGRFDLDGNAVDPGRGRSHGERFIHSEIYRARPDVNAIVHAHSLPLILFGVTGAALRPVYHMAGFLGAGVPNFDVRDEFGMTDMQISSPERGRALAARLADKPLALMRGHGAVIVGPSIALAVYRAIYAVKNAELQLAGPKLGEIAYLSNEEAARFEAMLNVTRAWDVWRHELGIGGSTR